MDPLLTDSELATGDARAEAMARVRHGHMLLVFPGSVHLAAVLMAFYHRLWQAGRSSRKQNFSFNPVHSVSLHGFREGIAAIDLTRSAQKAWTVAIWNLSAAQKKELRRTFTSRIETTRAVYELADELSLQLQARNALTAIRTPPPLRQRFREYLTSEPEASGVFDDVRGR